MVDKFKQVHIEQLKNGIKINDVFKIVQKILKKINFAKPLILMGYYNMIYQYGENNFLNRCKNSGVRWHYSC